MAQRSSRDPVDGMMDERLAIAQPEVRTSSTIPVESVSFEPGRSIPDVYSAYREGRSPELHWRRLPDGTRSVALLVEDPDAPRPNPFVHWIVYNIPADATSLPEAAASPDEINTIGGVRQGRTSNGTVGYFGPRPPAGDAAHHYHFELFALDTPLDLGPRAERDDLVAAMAGHVLGSGEIVGTYRAPPTRA